MEQRERRSRIIAFRVSGTTAFMISKALVEHWIALGLEGIDSGPVRLSTYREAGQATSRRVYGVPYGRMI